MYEGEVGDIGARQQKTGSKRRPSYIADMAKRKAITENAVYLSVSRLSLKKAKIL
jgi:hypothetical protein